MRMALSKSSNEATTTEASIQLPRRSLSLEFFVGIFAILSFAAVGYLAVGLGGLQIGSSDSYLIEAEFDNISGLKTGASVEIAGVKVGEVTTIELEDPNAIVNIKMNNGVDVRDDD